MCFASKLKMAAYGEKKGKTSTRKSKAKDVFEFDGDSDIGKPEVLISDQGKRFKHFTLRSSGIANTIPGHGGQHVHMLQPTDHQNQSISKLIA